MSFDPSRGRDASSGLDSRDWIDQDPSVRMALVEEWILQAALHDYDFWLSVVDRICKDPGNGGDLDDFERHERNIVFCTVRKFWNFVRDEGDPENSFSPDPAIFRQFLEQEAKQGNLCAEEEIPSVVAFYEQVKTSLNFNGSQALLLARKFMPPWISRRRARMLGTSARNFMYLEDLLVQGELHSDSVSTITTGNNDDFVLYGHQKRHNEPEDSVKLVGFGKLSDALGGFVRGDSYMFQSPSGGGKTVFAVQMAVEMIQAGLKGIFISTEQPWREIEPRIVACAASIDISQPFMKNRFNYEEMAKNKMFKSKVDDWERLAFERLAFYHWGKDNTQSVRTDMEATIRKGKAALKQDPDFVILDWLGGALGADTSNENLRFVYQTTADAFATVALKHRFIGITMAQSKADKTYYSLGSEQLAECKTAHRKFASLVGITAIPTRDDRNQDTVSNKYEKRQFFDVTKSRKGVPARIPVDRSFEFQRFVERI